MAFNVLIAQMAASTPACTHQADNISRVQDFNERPRFKYNSLCILELANSPQRWRGQPTDFVVLMRSQLAAWRSKRGQSTLHLPG